MALFETILSVLATKAGVTVAGVALVASGVGAAAATENLPDGIQTKVDELIGAERGDDGSSDVAESTEVVEDQAEVENEVDVEGRNGVADAATTAGDGLEGRERGEAVSDAVREANGSADQGQAEERRAEAATRAEAGRANADAADAADDAADAETDPAERQADAADEAAAGQGNADAVEGNDDLEADDEDDAAAGDADDARQDAEARPEGAGAPDTEG